MSQPIPGPSSLCGDLPVRPPTFAGCPLPLPSRSAEPELSPGLMPSDTCRLASVVDMGWGRGGVMGEIVGGFIMENSAGLGPSIVQVANK